MKMMIALICLLVNAIAMAAPSTPMLVKASPYDISLMYKTTKLPYNILFADGQACYVGTSSDVSEIVQKMIMNHQFAAKTVKVTGIDEYAHASSPSEIIVTVKMYDSSAKRDMGVAFAPCSIKR